MSKFIFTVCAKEVWRKALLIPGEQMQTSCLMSLPGNREKMAEPPCKQHYPRYVQCGRRQDGVKWVVLESWAMILWRRRKRIETIKTPGDSQTSCSQKYSHRLYNDSLSGIHSITSVVHCEVMWWFPSAWKTPNREKSADWLSAGDGHIQK